MSNYTRLTDEQFRALLNWYMASDPWPLDRDSHEVITDMLDHEAQKHGFPTWVEAYHEFYHIIVRPGAED